MGLEAAPRVRAIPTVYVDADNKLATREATETAAAVFKLPPEWPNCSG
jgi:hypothetical protein